MTVHFLQLFQIYFCDILPLSKSSLCCLHTVIYQPDSWFVRQQVFRPGDMCGKLRCRVKRDHITRCQRHFQIWHWLLFEAARPWPHSCPSLNRINPNYRHHPLKPKYYSQAWLLALRRWIVCVRFTPSTCLKEFNVPRHFKLSSPHKAIGSSVARTQSAWRSLSLSVCPHCLVSLCSFICTSWLVGGWWNSIWEVSAWRGK